MRHTAQPGTVLGDVCDEVSCMRPGEWLTIDRYVLSGIPRMWHNDTEFQPHHRVLENIIGSAYTHSARINMEDGSVTFMRHENTGERHYSSPDDAVRSRRLNDERIARMKSQAGSGS